MDNFKYSILYLGNKLSCHGFTPTGVETLGNRLKQITKVYTSSNKKNKLFRLFDMLFSIIKYRKKIDIIFIDFYSGLAFFLWNFLFSYCKIIKYKIYTNNPGWEYIYEYQKIFLDFNKNF